MDVVRYQDENLEPAYGILCRRVLPGAEKTTPFGMTYCEIEPNGKTSPHDHYDGEGFLILSGEGLMKIDGEERKVEAGDLVTIPNHRSHELTNLSNRERLKFVSIYWDAPAVSREISGDHIVYSAPPTPNGKLHVGHLSGPYLAADVARRYLKLRGVRAPYCTGADENQTYVTAKARQLGRAGEPLKVAQEYSRTIQEILERFSAKPDLFMQPHEDATYREYVQMFFSSLVKSGALELKTSEYPFCPQCDGFVHESSVSGACPHCSEKTNGSGCEACGLYNDGRDLHEPKCNVCGTQCALKMATRYVFPLARFKEKLTTALDQKSFAPRMRDYVDRLLAQGLQDVTVSYPVDWGIAVPETHAQVKGQVINEWFEAAAAHLYEAQKVSPTGSYDHFWVNPRGKTVLAFGFDNSFYYMALVPALLFAFDEKIRYPDAFLTNYFYQLDGLKFSTSRNHAVWGDEILQTTHPDALRLYLAKTRAEDGETNFTRKEFEEFVGLIAIGGLDRLMERVQALTQRPQMAKLDARARRLLETSNLLIQQAELALNPEHFSLNELSRVIERYREFLESFVKESEASQVVRGRALKAALTGFAQVLAPLCPEYASRLFSALGSSEKWRTHLDLPTDAGLEGQLPLNFFANRMSG